MGKTTVWSKVRNEKECPHSLLLLNIVIDFLPKLIGQEKQIKGIQIGKEVTAFLFVDYMSMYYKDPKDSTKTSEIS
jgi:hypothetical protein